MNLADLLEQSFPSIPRQGAESLHKLFAEYDVDSSWLYGRTGLSSTQIAQGDILTGLNAGFWDFKIDEAQARYRKRENCYGIALTNTCDNERKNCLTFAPLMDAEPYFSKIENDSLKESIKRNTVTELLFLPATNDYPALVGDFSMSFAVTQNFLSKLRGEGIVKRVHSLTTHGYYFLLAKLSLHFMRPEAPDVDRYELGT